MGGVLNTFAKKALYHGAIGFAGYKVGNYLDQESTAPVIVKPEIIVHPREDGVSAQQIIYVLVGIVTIFLALALLKFFIKSITPIRSPDIIPMYQYRRSKRDQKARKQREEPTTSKVESSSE